MPTSRGAAITCNRDGVVASIAHDQLDIASITVVGAQFVDMVDPTNRDKAQLFFAAIRDEGAAFDWELNMTLGGGTVLTHCMGCRDGDMVWVAIAETERAASRILEEMSLMQNEQSDSLRAAVKEASMRLRPAPGLQFDELTRLYNDSGLMQRELAQRNAELEALRERLEAQQEQLTVANVKLEQLATSDGLTGIANRRSFERRLEEECARTQRTGSQFSLIILDVDHFKSFNDTYGHQAGDEILKIMGRILSSNSRDVDLAARFGGEEFCVILIACDESCALGVAELLRKGVENEPWAYAGVTASFGVSSSESHSANPAEMIREADQAMYFSKHHGRNQVTHFLDMGSKKA